MPVVPWVQPFPTNWFESRDGGATYSSTQAATTTTQVSGGPTGQQRFRTQFTIPGNVAGTYFCTVSGDIYDANVNQPAHLYLDGVDQGAVTPLPGPRTFTLPVVPGPHTIELWIGQASGQPGLTVPTATFNFDNVVNTANVPCDCCPTDAPRRCALSPVRFTSANQTAPNTGWTPVGVNQTADGITNTTAITGYNTAGGFIPSTTLRVTYTLGQPWDRVRGFRLWNQCGNDLNDADGLGQFTADFYNGALLIWTATFTGANGGAPQDLLFPFFGELNGVTSAVLRDIHTQGDAAGVKPVWRELQLLVIRDVFPCRRSNGTVEWYDPDGNLIPQADVVACSPEPSNITAPTPFTVPDLHLQGFAFGDDLSGHGENLCNISPAPSATSGWSGPSGGCYDPTIGTPTMDWSATSGVDITYGGANVSGGVFMSFSSPTLGGITWPTNSAPMAIGEQRWSNFFGGGHLARVTYVSGPASGSNLHQNGADGGKQMFLSPNPSSQIIANMRFRLDFFTP